MLELLEPAELESKARRTFDRVRPCMDHDVAASETPFEGMKAKAWPATAKDTGVSDRSLLKMSCGSEKPEPRLAMGAGRPLMAASESDRDVEYVSERVALSCAPADVLVPTSRAPMLAVAPKAETVAANVMVRVARTASSARLEMEADSTGESRSAGPALVTESPPESALRLHWHESGIPVPPQTQIWEYADDGSPLFRIDVPSMP